MIKNFFIAFVSLLLSLCLAEGTVRMLGLAPEVVYIQMWRMQLSGNPDIGYEPIPNFDSREKSAQFYGYQSVSNSLGFRGKDYSAQKPEGVDRILVLGDSVVEGLWIHDDEHVYPAILEELFQKSGRKVEVLNFGVSGYNSMQEVATLEDKGLAFEPDLVVLTYCLNDKYSDDGGIIGHLKEAQKKSAAENIADIPSQWRILIQRSALLRLLRYRVFPPSQTVTTDPDTAKATQLESQVPAAFKRLADLQSAHDFKVLIVLFPDFDQMDDRTDSYEFYDEHTYVRALAEQFEFHFLDLLEPMRACKREHQDLLSFDRFHPRPLGNRCAALAVKEYVFKNGLIDAQNS